MPVRQCSAFQNLDTNNLSQSDIMSKGRLFLQYQCFKKIDASASADISVHVGIICMSDPSQSIIVKMQLKPSSSSSHLTKSIATDVPRLSGTGNGCNGPFGFDVDDLLHWQSTQPGTYADSKSLLMFGQ
jgi:hypothetical protein